MIELKEGRRLLPFSIFEEQSLYIEKANLVILTEDIKQWLLWDEPIYVPFIYKSFPIILVKSKGYFYERQF